MKIVVGNGVVGSALVALLSSCKTNEVFVYDKLQKGHNGDERKKTINSCELVFVTVPTPSSPDGISYDTSAVWEAVSWIEPPICIKSPIVPGTVDELTLRTGKHIAFSPEYVGESDGRV